VFIPRQCVLHLSAIETLRVEVLYKSITFTFTAHPSPWPWHWWSGPCLCS